MSFPTIADMEKFLGAEDEAITMPTGSFALPMGSIAPWEGGSLYSVSGVNAVETATKAGLRPDATRFARPREDGTTWQWCYYLKAREQEANAAQKLINGYSARYVFQIGTPFLKIIMEDAARLKWEADQSKWASMNQIYDIRITGLKLSSEGRMAYHLTWLPSAVDAAARLFGYIERPIVDFSDLLDVRNEPPQSDKLTAQYFSGPDGDWSESLCFKNRAALWLALGCDDPTISEFPGMKGTPLENSPLYNCLKQVTRPWHSLWAEIGQIADPRPVDKDKHQIPGRFVVACRLFTDEATARSYLANRGTTNGVTTEAMPALPATWATDGLSLDDWLSFLGEKYTALKGLEGTKRIAAAKTAFKDVVVDVNAWLAYAEAHNM